MRTGVCATLGLAFLLVSVAVGKEEQLVLQYSFDEGSGAVARDQSGNNRDGTIHGASYVKMPEGCALEFNGVDNYVDAGEDATLTSMTGDLTIEVWARNKATGPRDAALVSTHYGCNDFTRPYELVIFDNDGDQAQFRMGNGAALFSAASAERVKKDTWYHIAGTISGNDMTIYVNGVKTGSGTFAGARQAGRRLTIGSASLGTGRNFIGLLDDVKLYSRALSAEEIRAEYEAGVKKTVGVALGGMTSSPFRKTDTTPPIANLPTPPPGSAVEPNATVSARLFDAGSGVNPAAVSVFLDGRDMTPQAQVTETGVSLRPPAPLAQGAHRAEVRVADRAGNRGNALQWRFSVGQPAPTEARFNGGVFLVDGEPFFPVGIYNVDTRPWRSEALLAQSAEAGVNYQLLDEQSATPEMLDKMLKHGQKAVMLIHLGDTVKPFLAGDAARMEWLFGIRAHPAMMAWWAEYPQPTDEWVRDLTRVRQWVKEKDPGHPVLFMVSWPSAYKKCCVTSDVYYVYMYPVLDRGHPEQGVVSLYHAVLGPALAAAEAEGKGKQVWFISQAYDPRLYDRKGQDAGTPPEGGFRPNPMELRAMNYLAVAKGVRGLLFYAPGPDVPGTRDYDTVVRYPEPWTALLKLAGEFRYLAPDLASGKAVHTARMEPDHPEVHYLELRHGERHTLIAVNTGGESVQVRWRFARAVQPVALFEDRALAEKKDDMVDTFEPLAVHVYQWEMPDSEFNQVPAQKVEEKRAAAPKVVAFRKKDPTGSAVTCKVTATPPELDGRLDEPCWRQAGAMTDFIMQGSKDELAGVQTEVKIVATKEALYAAFRCDEPNMDGLLQQCKSPDGDVWYDDCVELWLDTAHDRKSAYHFVINPLGTVYDEKVWDEESAGKKSSHGDRSWDSHCQVKVLKGEDFWTVELKIPAGALGMAAINPGAGVVWGVNAARVRRSRYVCDMSSWTGVFTTPISSFGTLRLE